MADLGADLLLDAQGLDLVVDATDEPRQVSGGALVRQGLAEALRTPLGSLPWDPAAGSSLLQMLNSDTADGVVAAEILRVARAEPRIDVASIRVQAPAAAGKPWRVVFRPLGAVDEQALEFGV